MEKDGQPTGTLRLYRFTSPKNLAITAPKGAVFTEIINAIFGSFLILVFALIAFTLYNKARDLEQWYKWRKQDREDKRRHEK